MLEDLKPESEGAKEVNKEIEDFENCWRKLEKDVKNKIEKVRLLLCVKLCLASLDD